ncbi:MAG: carbon storage regulator CsrA [Elusimicrobiota bacterium]
MLLLTRRRRQSIVIGDDIEITVLKIEKSQVHIGIKAPKTLPIFRQEIYQVLKLENQASANSSPTSIQKAIQFFRKKPL